MNEEVAKKISTLPQQGLLLILAFILSGALFYFLGWGNPSALLLGVIVVAFFFWWLVRLRQWSKMDKSSRPAMKFPKKLAHFVFWTLFFGGLFTVWLVRELGKGFSNWH